MTHVNDIPVNDEPNSPFGGEKQSGTGRFESPWALDEFTTSHWITFSTCLVNTRSTDVWQPLADGAPAMAGKIWMTV